MTRIVSRLPLLSGWVVAGSLLSSVAEAGTPGALVYAPTAVVPSIQGVSLLILAVLLGFVALRVLMQQVQPNRLAAVVALGVSVVLASLGGVQVVSDAYAIMGPTSLNNPAGASVVVPQNYTEYSNDSGVSLTIASLVFPTCPTMVGIAASDTSDSAAVTNGIPACTVNLVLPPNVGIAACFTDPCFANGA